MQTQILLASLLPMITLGAFVYTMVVFGAPAAEAAVVTAD